MPTKVIATVLAHDAGPSLEGVLRGLAAQTRAPDGILVLDNGGRDGASVRVVCEHHGAALVRSDENLGVGGGHGRLFLAALEDPTVTHVWALEHDSFAAPGCLAAILDVEEARSDQGGEAAVLYAHLERNAEEAAAAAAGSKEPWRAGARFTFNGVLLPRAVIERVGLPRADFFVGCEDWEYAARIEKAGFPILEVPPALVLHPTKGNRRFGVRPSVSRSYYSTRNWMRFRIERDPAFGSIRACAWCVLSIGKILLRDDDKVRRAAARLAATGDALASRMGPRSYWFLGP